VLATATSESVRYQACTSGSKSTRMASMLRLLVPVSDGYHDIARDHDLEPATRRRPPKDNRTSLRAPGVARLTVRQRLGHLVRVEPALCHLLLRVAAEPHAP